MTTEEIKTLRTNLKKHYGAMTEIAERCEVTLSYVGYVLRGEKDNAKVLEVACEVLLERLSQAKLSKQKTRKLIEKANEVMLSLQGA